MVDELDDVFLAVASPIRRDLIARLAEGPQRVGDLAARYDVSLNAVSKHLKVLEAAGLVSRRVQGREHLLTAHPEKLLSAMEWMRHYERFWTTRLDALADLLERTEPTPPGAPS